MVWEGTKNGLSMFWSALWFILGLLTISNIKYAVTTIRGMTFTQLLMAVGGFIKKTVVFITKLVFSIIW